MSAINTITVHVKNMAGDLIHLVIDSSKGIHAIQAGLGDHDPTLYGCPLRIFPLEDHELDAPFYDGMTFGVYVYPPPHCNDIQSYDQVDCFEFQVCDQPIYLYTIVTADHKLIFRFSKTFVPLDDAYLPHIHQNHGGYYPGIFQAAGAQGHFIHPRYMPSIIDTILTFIHIHRDHDAQLQSLVYEPIWCACGAVIQRKSIAAHQKSQKHIDKMKHVL